jgi:hypothetical protein
MQPNWSIANTTAVAQRNEIGILFDWRVTGSVVTTNPALTFRRAHQHACSLNATMPEDRMVWCCATSCGSNISTPCHRRRGTWRESEDAASIIRPPATKTEGRLNSDNSNEKTAGGPSCATSRKLTNTVVISERS